ncbi:HAD family hydrolase [Longimicrobium sp.]|uniref:HAD family hydrolase n=1 Tax=Longimicrobium sp. TaxID=2029185 RepID=UPI002E318CB5|nr:HAD hydrolase-like protein [Longimicrobium sp.]HEX6038526.1 HAD hydrolase-like protein [Longimicrobium sp.]
MRRLVLFDIDGTLLSAGGAGARALRDALLEVFGETGPIGAYSMGGRTDPQIVRELMTATGRTVDEIEPRYEELWALYLRNLRGEVARTEIRTLPGVPALLDRVEAGGDSTLLALLTGNVQEGARMKVEAAGLGFHRFRVGAYGSDHWERKELPAVAVRRARALTDLEFQGKEIVIIGDTPFDIACGEHLGVRTIAVATGGHPAEELAACGPDYLFEDLSDVDAVWRAIAD